MVAFGHQVYFVAEFWISTFLENKNKSKNHLCTNPHPLFPPKLHKSGIFIDYPLQSHWSDLWLVRNPILWRHQQRGLVCPLSWNLVWVNKSLRQRLALLCLKPCQSMLWKYLTSCLTEFALSPDSRMDWYLWAVQDSCMEFHYWNSSGHFPWKSSP